MKKMFFKLLKIKTKNKQNKKTWLNSKFNSQPQYFYINNRRCYYT